MSNENRVEKTGVEIKVEIRAETNVENRVEIKTANREDRKQRKTKICKKHKIKDTKWNSQTPFGHSSPLSSP